LWVGIHKSWYHNQEAYFVRFFDKNGQLLLNSKELTEQERREKEQERQAKEQAQLKAEKLAAKLRELGIDPSEL
jgi:hypothetical protein